MEQTIGKTEIVTFSFSEIAKSLICSHDIHEGLWGIYVEFGLAATNAGPSQDNLTPAAVVPLMKIGLQRFNKPSNLTADAAIVNPK